MSPDFNAVDRHRQIPWAGIDGVRSPFVARDFKRKGEKDREDLFCATPPLELLMVANCVLDGDEILAGLRKGSKNAS